MKKIHIIASNKTKAQVYKMHLESLFPVVPLNIADVCIILGGDGFMLHTLHHLYNDDALRVQPNVPPIYGINCGTVGFLLNALPFDVLENLDDILEKAVLTPISPLMAQCTTETGVVHSLRAINEVTFMRQSDQACNVSLMVNQVMRLERLTGDGVLIATPAGSTAYNYSAGGPILPLGTKALALTPLNPYRPRRWGGAILPNSVRIDIAVMDPAKRPVYVTADCESIQNIQKVSIYEDPTVVYKLLFDASHNLENRILNQQFQADSLWAF